MRHLDDEINETHSPAEVDKRDLLELCVLDVSDRKGWKIREKDAGSRHPGVCWQIDNHGFAAVLYKGSSQQPKRSKYLEAFAILEPNPENGLALRTYFDVSAPFLFRLRKVELLYHDALVGKLTDSDAALIATALADLQGTENVN